MNKEKADPQKKITISESDLGHTAIETDVPDIPALEALIDEHTELGPQRKAALALLKRLRTQLEMLRDGKNARSRAELTSSLTDLLRDLWGDD